MRRPDQLIICVVLVVYIVTAVTLESPVVKTAQGKLRGCISNSWVGKPVHSFIGVRFAQPPVGQNRFQDPVPVKPWRGIRNAIKHRPFCPQSNSEGFISSEDCLFLNVHTKSLTGKKPVMIFFHPGGYVAGAGTNIWTGPQLLMDQDIVLVSSNYRIGALGFMSTGDSVMPGNYGLRDQLAAMLWVKQNIAVFGGDPHCVTLFSHRADLIQLHLVSPLSEGLFHRVITSSCSATTPAVLNRDPATLSRRYANLLNCPTDTSQQIRDCLLQQPVTDILAAESRVIWQNPLSLIAPVVEKQGGEDRFLRDDPAKLFQSGQFAHIPLITCITWNEIVYGGNGQLHFLDSTFIKHTNDEFDDTQWKPHPVSERVTAIEQFYLNFNCLSNSTEAHLKWLYANPLITDVHQATKLITKKTPASLFFYEFDFEMKGSLMDQKYMLGTQLHYAIAHHEELLYFFHSPWFPLLNQTVQTDSEHERITLTHTYTNFVPGVPTLGESTTRWNQLTRMQLRHLNIAKPPTMKSEYPYPDLSSRYCTDFVVIN